MAPVHMYLRPQISAKMIIRDSSITFDELVQYKHSTHIELADRILDDLMLAIDQSGSTKAKKAFNACKKYNAVILDKTNKSCVIQITALRREIDKMSKNLKKFGLISVSRTGAVAMTRGAETFK